MTWIWLICTDKKSNPLAVGRAVRALETKARTARPTH